MRDDLASAKLDCGSIEGREPAQSILNEEHEGMTHHIHERDGGYLDDVRELLLGIRPKLNFSEPQPRRNALQQPLVQVHGVGNADHDKVALRPCGPVEKIVQNGLFPRDKMVEFVDQQHDGLLPPLATAAEARIQQLG